MVRDFATKDRPFAYAADQVETAQQRRAAFVAGVVDRAAELIHIDRAAPVASWLAAGVLVLLAGGTVTNSVSGPSVRLLCATMVYFLLAAFVAPPVRGYLHWKRRVTLSRSVVVTVLIVGILVNEAALAPPTEAAAAIVAGSCVRVRVCFV